MAGRIFLTVIAVGLLPACATTGDDIHSEEIVIEDIVPGENFPNELTSDSELGQPLSVTEMNGVLVGRTYPITNGGIYFHSESIATVYQNDESEETDWWQNGNSEFCHSATIFGGTEECIGLFRHQSGDYLHSYRGTTRLISEDDIFPGNLYD